MTTSRNSMSPFKTMVIDFDNLTRDNLIPYTCLNAFSKATFSCLLVGSIIEQHMRISTFRHHLLPNIEFIEHRPHSSNLCSRRLGEIAREAPVENDLRSHHFKLYHRNVNKKFDSFMKLLGLWDIFCLRSDHTIPLVTFKYLLDIACAFITSISFYKAKHNF